MKHFVVLLLVLGGCATPPPPPAPEPEAEEPLRVSIDVALEHIGQSYTLGCVEALKKRGEKNIYLWCRERGMQHQTSVKKIIDGSMTEGN